MVLVFIVVPTLIVGKKYSLIKCTLYFNLHLQYLFIFIQAKYIEKISEAIPPYSYLLTVQATDADDGKNALQIFSLKGNGANDFLIDSTTGKIFYNCMFLLGVR